MEETIRKMIKTGYGLGLLTLAEAKKVADKIKKELSLDDKKSKALAKELMTSSKKASKDVMKVAGKHIERALVKSGLTSKKEIRRVKKVVRKRVKNTLKSKRAGILCKLMSK